ncbi:MAG: ATP-binding cassette domain-containing protein, partial [Clostridium sp.]
MSEKILELINVTKIFKSKQDKRKIYGLDNINISIHEGEVIGVFGRKDAGKSTLLKVIGEKMEPTYGHIDFTEEKEVNILYIDGKEINGDEGQIKSHLSTSADIYILDNVFEDFNNDEREFYKLKLKELVDASKTLIICERDIDFLSDICNSAIWVENGKVRMHDTYLRVSESFINFENRFEHMTDEEKEELQKEWDNLRVIQGEYSKQSPINKGKGKKVCKSNHSDYNHKGIVKYGVAALGVTLIIAGGFVFYNKMNDDKAAADNKPPVVASKPEGVGKKIKYEKDMTFAYVMTSKFDNKNLGLREYLKDVNGQVVDSISIVTLKEDGYEVELQELSPYVQVNLPSKKLNDQLKYSLL